MHTLKSIIFIEHIRAVSDDQRVYALGISTSISRVAGNIPGPILIGAFIDYSCILWNNDCSSSSTCWIYDSQKMSSYLYGSLVVVKLISTTFFMLSWWFYTKIPVIDSSKTNDLKDFNDTPNGISLIEYKESNK